MPPSGGGLPLLLAPQLFKHTVKVYLYAMDRCWHKQYTAHTGAILIMHHRMFVSTKETLTVDMLKSVHAQDNLPPTQCISITV